MPRQSRIDAPGAVQHIMVRGIEGKAIFRSNGDREDFLLRLGRLLLETSTSCYAWALLDNHAHLLLRTGMVPAARLMGKVLTGYAGSFNRRYRRHGHLFQNRYKSILCEEDPYLQELVRYIHLNPLRAGLVNGLEELEVYPYSGHSVLAGRRKRDWQDREYVLSCFGRTEGEAGKKYLLFVSEGAEKGRRPELAGGGIIRSAGGWKEYKELRGSGVRLKGDERILGGSEFVERVLRENDEQWTKNALLKKRGVDLGRVIEKTAAHFGVEPEDLKSGNRSRGIARARAVVCYVAIRQLGLTCAGVAKELNVSPSAVSRSIMRGRKGLKADTLEERILKSQ